MDSPIRNGDVSTAAVSELKYATSGLIPLTKPQLVGTLTGLLLGMLLAALDQTIVGTAEPRIIAQLSGFDGIPGWRRRTC